MCPEAVSEGGGAELGEHGGRVGGGGGGGQGGPADLGHVRHHVVRGGAHDGQARVTVLHLGREEGGEGGTKQGKVVF